MDFSGVIQSEQDYKLFVKYLFSISKNESVEHKARHIAIINTKQNVIAIAMSSIRKTAKKILKNGYDWFLNYSLNNSYHNEYYEETLIQGLVIAEIKDLEKQKSYFELWIKKIDNWSTCDSTVSTMKFLKNSSQKSNYFKFYLNLCFCEDEFVARFGIIVLMTCYLEEMYIDDIFEMCRKVKSDLYYINMALAWLLSYAFMSFKAKTYKLFGEKSLSKFVQNKAICKCRDSFQVLKEDKENLINYRLK